MSATQTMLSKQFIDVMGPMISDAKAVDCVFSYIRLLRNTQVQQDEQMAYTQQEIDQRLDQSEEAFALGKGISESVARQHRHNFVNELIAR